mmetsp:Transcript_100043/g.238425  ORF Transcript_100043/g.238425 Transcript_100043/m.238425 type:complete len:245 (+) Transcript_100043:572-1306(+)
MTPSRCSFRPASSVPFSALTLQISAESGCFFARDQPSVCQFTFESSWSVPSLSLSLPCCTSEPPCAIGPEVSLAKGGWPSSCLCSGVASGPPWMVKAAVCRPAELASITSSRQRATTAFSMSRVSRSKPILLSTLPLPKRQKAAVRTLSVFLSKSNLISCWMPREFLVLMEHSVITWACTARRAARKSLSEPLIPASPDKASLSSSWKRLRSVAGGASTGFGRPTSDSPTTEPASEAAQTEMES